MTFIYLLLIIFITILLFGVMIIAKVLRTIFGIGRRMTRQSEGQKNPFGKNNNEENPNGSNNRSNYTYQETSESKETPHRYKKKVFDDNEGEYIEFEEIKD